MTGLLSTSNGLFYGHGIRFFGVQLIGVVSVALWVGVSMTIVFAIIDKAVGLRVSEREEIEGLDSTEHGLANAYADFLPNFHVDNLSAQVDNVLGVKKKNVPVEEAIPVHKGERAEFDKGGGVLSKVEILMKQSRFEKFKDAMNEIGVTGMTVTQVVGCGLQKGATEYYRGSAVDMNLLPKVKVEIVVAKVPVEDVVKAARQALYTGHIGDGKIFIYDVRDSVKIRTGETGYDALQGVDDL
jgi:Amt family ammonium transporter